MESKQKQIPILIIHTHTHTHTLVINPCYAWGIASGWVLEDKKKAMFYLLIFLWEEIRDIILRL